LVNYLVDQSQHIGTADQSEHNKLFGRRVFLETGNKLTDWKQRCCNNVKYVKSYKFFEHSSMKTYSSRPQKQKKNFVKGHNMASLISCILLIK